MTELEKKVGELERRVENIEGVKKQKTLNANRINPYELSGRHSLRNKLKNKRKLTNYEA